MRNLLPEFTSSSFDRTDAGRDELVQEFEKVLTMGRTILFDQHEVVAVHIRDDQGGVPG